MSSIDKDEILLEGLTPPVSHYAHAVRFGDLLFISGMVGLDADSNVVSDDVAEQTEKIFQDIGRLLDHVGADFSNILKVTVFMTNVDDRSKINPVRQKYFGKNLPASTLIGISALVLPGLKVEIEAVVGLPQRNMPS